MKKCNFFLVFIADENSVDQFEFSRFQSKISYDLRNASSRQFQFFYNVSLPHFRNSDYLKLAVDRYKKFLYMKQNNPTVLVVPCYSIDLMWHTHQLNPQLYTKDTITILGKIFPHDDSINDRTPGGLLDISGRATKDIWRGMFNEEFFMPGGMYRGEAPTSDLYSSNKHINYNFISSWLGEYELKEVSLKGNHARESDCTFSIFVHGN